jgi:hypothetical protein
MPGNIPRTQVHRRDFSALQLPCGSCPRWFKTVAGRTKHCLAAHPVPPVVPRASRSPELNFEMDVDEGRTDYDIDMGDPPRQPSPQPNIDTEFFGPGNRLYRNYHMGLDGTFICWPVLSYFSHDGRQTM